MHLNALQRPLEDLSKAFKRRHLLEEQSYQNWPYAKLKTHYMLEVGWTSLHSTSGKLPWATTCRKTQKKARLRPCRSSESMDGKHRVTCPATVIHRFQRITACPFAKRQAFQRPLKSLVKALRRPLKPPFKNPQKRPFNSLLKACKRPLKGILKACFE